MTPALLKQAREAAQKFLDCYVASVESGDWGFWDPEGEPEVITLRQSIAALTAFDSLSEYDKAIHTLAPYLPDGWVAQDSSCWPTTHRELYWYECEPKSDEDSWRTPMGYSRLNVRIPWCEDWRDSLRRITHNSDGTVTVTKG